MRQRSETEPSEMVYFKSNPTLGAVKPGNRVVAIASSHREILTPPYEFCFDQHYRRLLSRSRFSASRSTH